MTEQRYKMVNTNLVDDEGLVYYLIKRDGNDVCQVFGKHTAKKIIDELNTLHEENQLKFEILEAFIRGMEDEKGIDPTNKEFQCRMNHTIKVLKRLKEMFENPNEFK